MLIKSRYRLQLPSSRSIDNLFGINATPRPEPPRAYVQQMSSSCRYSSYHVPGIRRIEWWSKERTSPSERIKLQRARPFTSSTIFCKGKKFKNRDDDSPEHQAQTEQGSSSTDYMSVTEALSMASLKTEVKRIQDKLKRSLSLLKPGGQFNPILIETLKVDMSKLVAKEPSNPSNNRNHAKDTQTRYVKNDPDTHEQDSAKGKNTKRKPNKPPAAASAIVPLKDIAQVIPRGGKAVIIMLNEADFIKPVSSALLSSPYSLNPQPSADNTLELIVPIPAPSAEMRKLNLSQVDKQLERAEHDLREGRGDVQKTLRSLSLSSSLRPDDHRKGQKDMEKVVEEARFELKRFCDAAKKALQ